MQMEDPFTFVFHHGGKFVKDSKRKLIYEGGQIETWLGVNEDTLYVFSVIDCSKRLGYHKVDNCFWLVPRKQLSNGLRAWKTDRDLLDLCRDYRANDKLIQLYYENPMIENPEFVLEVIGLEDEDAPLDGDET